MLTRPLSRAPVWSAFLKGPEAGLCCFGPAWLHHRGHCFAPPTRSSHKHYAAQGEPGYSHHHAFYTRAWASRCPSGSELKGPQRS